MIVDYLYNRLFALCDHCTFLEALFATRSPFFTSICDWAGFSFQTTNDKATHVALPNLLEAITTLALTRISLQNKHVPSASPKEGSGSAIVQAVRQSASQTEMLQFSSSPITPRPRPPRSRSSQLSSSVGSGASTASPSVKARLPDLRNNDAAMLTTLQAAAAAVDTPPYTPEMLDVDSGPAAGVSETLGEPSHARTASELQEMLDEAHRVIQERERGQSAYLP